MTDWQDCRVLVTGAGSFIGRALTIRIANAGASLRCVVRTSVTGLEGDEMELLRGDLRDRRFADKALSGMDVVFHLASGSGNRNFVESNPVGVWGNTQLDFNVVFAAAEAKVSSFVHASSATTYPASHRQAGTPLSEDLIGPPYDPDGVFGWSKLSAERMLVDCGRASGMRTVSCRIFSPYGENANHENAISTWVRRALRADAPIELWGGGTQRRSWIHVDDVVEGLLVAAKKVGSYPAVNIGGSPSMPIAETVRLILEISNSNVEPEIVSYSGGAISHQVADNSRMMQLGWSPTVDLRTGITRVVAAAREECST